ncbi:MAG: hypothetical protein ABH839_00660 [Chloroflexota bacterium]
MKVRLISIVGLAAVLLLAASCARGDSFSARLGSIVQPYRFSIARWEYEAIPYEIKQGFADKEVMADGEAVVRQYFSLDRQIEAAAEEIEIASSGNGVGDVALLRAGLDRLASAKEALTPEVEGILVGQIREALAAQGIFHPMDKYIDLKASFPPLNFKLDELPNLLVISPRDRIESVKEVTLEPGISLEEIEGIESRTDQLGVSSLVVELGGFGGTYPTMVGNRFSLRFTLDTIIEEWLHQYLAFRPLGFLYLLDATGMSRDYEIATMNETVAGMVGKEIGGLVYEKYYARYDGDGGPGVPQPEFDFNKEMREIRRMVDRLLAEGDIEGAEEFMERKRQYLATEGYYIRKLNQAYFAFHGAYADSPTSISPIGIELRQLRVQSASLKEFLDAVAPMTSRRDLQAKIR